MNIIKTTPAMSLLYECINGIIQGGILEAVEGTSEGEEVASLCVSKLREMLVVDGDPNCKRCDYVTKMEANEAVKYVTILAIEKMIKTHSHLVAQHQDVILKCIEDADISIRMRTLGLIAGMVNCDNIILVVETLMQQLRNASPEPQPSRTTEGRQADTGITPEAESDEEGAEESLQTRKQLEDENVPLPEEYRPVVIRHILDWCSANTYTNIPDFTWYIRILVQLVGVCPVGTKFSNLSNVSASETEDDWTGDISFHVGSELQNVAVRVRSSRAEACQAAETLVSADQRDRLFAGQGAGGTGVLESAAWVVGEYADLLIDRESTLMSLIHTSTLHLPERIIIRYLQAVPKLLASLTKSRSIPWTADRKTAVKLLFARVINFLEQFVSHLNIEIQERAVSFLELMRLAAEGVAGHKVAAETLQSSAEPPLLLTQVIPSLFTGLELNPVAPGAQKKVLPPEDLDLDMPINPQLQVLLQEHYQDTDADNEDDDDEDDESYHYYYKRPVNASHLVSASDRLTAAQADADSYQQGTPADDVDVGASARLKEQRMQRNKDDPFYISSEHPSGVSKEIHDILRASNGDEVDIDSIPIMNLSLGMQEPASRAESPSIAAVPSPRRRSRQKVEILSDENVETVEASDSDRQFRVEQVRPSQSKSKKSLLQVDSSALGSLSLEEFDDSRASAVEIERRRVEEEEMKKALDQIERLRRELERASERIDARNGPSEGTLVKKKKKKRTKVAADSVTDEIGEAVVKTKKKKRRKAEDEAVKNEKISS